MIFRVQLLIYQRVYIIVVLLKPQFRLVHPHHQKNLVFESSLGGLVLTVVSRRYPAWWFGTYGHQAVQH